MDTLLFEVVCTNSSTPFDITQLYLTTLYGCYFRLAPSFLLQCIFSLHHDILGVLKYH